MKVSSVGRQDERQGVSDVFLHADWIGADEVIDFVTVHPQLLHTLASTKNGVPAMARRKPLNSICLATA